MRNGNYTPPREVVGRSRCCSQCHKSDLYCICGDEHHRQQVRRIIGRVQIEEGNDHE